MPKEPKKQKKAICITCIAISFALILIGCYMFVKINKSDENANTQPEKIKETKDTEENILQREALFSHISLNMDDYQPVHNRDTDDGTLQQWWYQDGKNKDNGIYIAIGDVKKNGGGFAVFGDAVPEIDDSISYILEISTGAMAEDGYFQPDSDTMSYYFVQQGEDIAFVSMKQMP